MLFSENKYDDDDIISAVSYFLHCFTLCSAHGLI